MLLPIDPNWFNVTVDPIINDAGELTGAVHIISDITEIKTATDNLRKSEEKFRLIAENSIDDIWQLDLEGNVTYVSPAKEKLFGYTPEEAKKMHFSEFIDESDLSTAREYLPHCQGILWTAEIIHPRQYRLQS